MKKLSIITINYNDLDGLKKTVESVQEQTYQDFEHIVIDGGSDDGSEVYIEKYSTRFNYSVSEPDTGVYNAMNKGIIQAQGEYLLFLNSGDSFYKKQSLENVINDIEPYDIAYCNQMVMGKDKKYLKTYPETLSFAYFLKDNIPHQATFMKKSLFENFGVYDEDLKIVADWKFFIDCICKHQVSYKYLNKTLVNFYLGGISSNPNNQRRMETEKQEILASNYKAFMQDLDNVLIYQHIINSLRRSRIIRLLVKLKFLNKF